MCSLRLVPGVPAAAWYPPSESTKLFHCLLNGLKLLYDGIHGVFLEIHLLRKRQNFQSVGSWHDNDPIAIGDNNVAGVDTHAIARHRNLSAGKAIVVH